MVPVIEVDTVDITVNRVKHLHLDAGVLDGLKRIIGKPCQISKIVEDDMNFHPSGGPLLQYRENTVPDLSLRQNVVLQKNIDLRVNQPVHQIVKKGPAVSKIPDIRIPVQPELPFLEVSRQTAPGR